MTTINDELVKAFGVDNNWSNHISSCIKKRAQWSVRRGYFDDIFADVSSDLIIKSKEGGLADALSKSKENSSTDVELLKNVKNVVTCAVFYRISNVLKSTHEKRSAVAFSQLSDDTFEWSIPECKSFDGLDSLVEELRVMILEKPESTDRYELAITMLFERLAGWSQTDLNQKHDLTSYQIKCLNQDWNTAYQRMEKNETTAV